MSLNDTQIKYIADRYGCTITHHSSDDLSGLYVIYKGKEELLGTWQEVITLTKTHEVCQRVSGKSLTQFWTGGQA